MPIELLLGLCRIRETGEEPIYLKLVEIPLDSPPAGRFTIGSIVKYPTRDRWHMFKIGEFSKLSRVPILDFIHLVDKKRGQGKLISPTKEKSNAYLASRNYDHIDAIYASV